MTTWFTADTHFSHANIIKYCQRPFNSADEMNSFMIKAWNDKVGVYDHIWHLGDFGFFKEPGSFEAIFHSLNGIKHLIIGNHDSKAVINGPWDTVDEYRELKVDGKGVVLFHYPIASWNGKFHGIYHFYGHSHGQLALGKGAIDVGVDCWGFQPITLEEGIAAAASAKENNNPYKLNHE